MKDDIGTMSIATMTTARVRDETGVVVRTVSSRVYETATALRVLRQKNGAVYVHIGLEDREPFALGGGAIELSQEQALHIARLLEVAARGVDDANAAIFDDRCNGRPLSSDS